MSTFPDWKKYIAIQRRLQTGCIATAYEILLRAAATPGIDFAKFQDEFDLDHNGVTSRNTFDSVAQEVQKKYPAITFTKESFAKDEGNKKLARVEEFLAARRPVIVSLANAPFGGLGWHIMVVVDATATDLTFLEYVDQQGNPHTKIISKTQFAAIHDNYAGGDEIAYLESP